MLNIQSNDTRNSNMTNPTPHLIAFAGSLRKDSYNKILVNLAADKARESGAKVTVIDLKEYPLPIFDEDLEAELNSPELTALRALLASANGLLIASPEYNGSFSSVLKNTLDWLSRPAKDESYSPVYGQLTVGLMAASPGGLGGIRGLSHIRELMSNLGSLVVPNQIAVGAAYKEFDENGQLNNAATNDRLTALVQQVIDYARV
jgi:chromate reductase